MKPVGKVVARALRLLRIIDANKAPSAGDMATGIEALNDLLRRWEANGLALGWQDVQNPADPMPCPPEAIRAIQYNLAVELRAEYGTSLDPDVYKLAGDGLAALRRDRAIASPLRYSGPCEYNTVTDDWCGGPARISYP